jgi:hypothetical protein
VERFARIIAFVVLGSVAWFGLTFYVVHSDPLAMALVIVALFRRWWRARTLTTR